MVSFAALLWVVMGGLAATAQGRVVDRIAAVVNDEIITASDWNWAVTLETQPNGQGVPLDRWAVLQRLIDERLIAQEAVSGPPINLPPEQIEEAVARLRLRFPSPEAGAAALREHGISEAELRRQVRQKIIVLQFIDQRFRPFVLVQPDEIQKYYEGEFRAELRRRQVSKLPDLEEVREPIEAILVERQVSRDLERWVRELRERASVRLLVSGPAGAAR